MDKQLTAAAPMGILRRPEDIGDENLGADETIKDAALAGVMGENYADEEAEERL